MMKLLRRDNLRTQTQNIKREQDVSASTRGFGALVLFLVAAGVILLGYGIGSQFGMF